MTDRSPASRPAAEPDEEPAIPTARAGFDAYAHLQSGRAQPRSVKALPAIAWSAIGLARRASPKLFWFVIAGQALAAVLLGVQVLLGKLAIEAVLSEADEVGGGSLGRAIAPLIALAVVSAVAGLLTSGQTLLQRLLGEKVQQLTWTRILAVTTTVGLVSFDDPVFFDDLQRVKVNALVRPLTMATGLVQVVGGALSVIGLGVTLVIVSPLLLPLLLLGGGPLFLLTRRSSRMEFAFTMRQTPARRVRSYLERVLTDRPEAKEVRAFDLGGPLQQRWEASYRRYFSELEDHVRTRVLLAAAGALVTAVASSLALGFLVYLIVEDEVALATAGAALIAVRLFSGRVQQLFNGVGQLFESSLFLQDLDRFLARAPLESQGRGGAADGAAPAPAPDGLVELEADRVSFRYPGSHRDAVSEVSMSIRRGEVIALVGENGSGKTTLAKVLGQMYEPTGGRVLWNGADAATLDARALREHVGVIFQDFIRYQLSARDNIGLARADALDDLERVELAARRGGAHETIAGLPQGYETSLGKEFSGGYDLSGGQWQRIALARAFFRDAGLLVLDEPTAALDARSEHEIFEYVRELAAGRSLLLISHRFSTVKSADRIYVLDVGRVIEAGSHDELMALGGRYAELFELQASAYR